MDCVLGHLKARRRRRRRRQGKEELEKTAKASMDELVMHPPVKSPPRARQVRRNTLPHPVLQLLHSQLRTLQHPLLQPLHPWLRV